MEGEGLPLRTPLLAAGMVRATRHPLDLQAKIRRQNREMNTKHLSNLAERA